MGNVDRVFDEGRVLKDNAMLKHRPELFYEWDFEKNDELGLDVYEVSYGTGDRAWWECRKCSGKWDAQISKRASVGRNCPFCAGRRVLVGFNDMWTTNPELASLLADPDDGYKHTQNTNKKLDWKCPICFKLIEAKNASMVNRSGLSCPVCSDGISYGEKFIATLLEENSVEYTTQKIFSEWGEEGKRIRYDFFLPEINTIVEVHGAQHYSELLGFGAYGGRTHEEEKENDLRKKALAEKNGIKNYIVINAKISTPDYLYNSIVNSRLTDIIKIIDKKLIAKRVDESSLVMDVCNLWNSGVLIKDIASRLQISRQTVRKYLKRGKDAGFCNYNEKESATKGKKEIVQLTMSGDFIRTWSSASSAAKHFNVSTVAICRVARGGEGRHSSAGFRWMYAEEYYKEE